MELIHANENLEEIGYITQIDKFDGEISQELKATVESNSFSLTVTDSAWRASPICEGHYVYIPNTEWGGQVEQLRHSTAAGQVTLSGVTWRGMIYRKVIEPPAMATHLVISGEANAAIKRIMGNTLGLFAVSAEDSGIAVSRSFRYYNMLIGIQEMLASSGAALEIAFDQKIRGVRLLARAIVDYSQRIDLSQDYGVDMVTTVGGFNRYNHIIALGAGELEDRDILHVYRLDDGTITTDVPAWAGTMKDHVRTYDYNNPESVEKLREGAEELLAGFAPLHTIEIDPGVAGLDLKMGDKVGARDRLIGMTGIVTVIGKVLTMDDNGIKTETRVG